MAAGCKFSLSPVFTVFLVCLLACNSFTFFKIRLSHPKTCLHPVGGVIGLETTRNFFVALTSRVRHLGTRAKGYFGTDLTRYPNSVSTFNISRLVQCGDIEINPGPGQSLSPGLSTTRKKPLWKCPCDVCTKPVRSNQKGILCDGCNKWFHLKCITMDLQAYIDLGSSDEQWFCDKNCGWPFNFTDSFFESSFSTGQNVSLSSDVSAESSPRSANGFSKCLLLNTRSIRNKINDLNALLLMDSFDIVALTETWLDNEFDDRDLHLEGYSIHRRDRRGKRGGGVLLATKSHLPCVRRHDLEVNAEMLACELKTSNTRCLLFAVFYRPPDVEETFLDEFRRFLNKASGTGIADLIITGDFNFPCVDWSTGSPTSLDNLTETFCEILDDHFLTQTNPYITRPSATNTLSSGNILDLVLTNHESLIEGTTVHPNGFDSDHFPVCFAIKKKFNRPKNSQRLVYRYDKADIDGLRNTFSHILWDSYISCEDIDSGTANFQDLVLAAVNQHVPKMKLRRKPRPPWIDKEVLKLVRKKKVLWKRLRANASLEVTTKFKFLRKQTKRLISFKYFQYLKSLSDKLKTNPRKFWSFHSLKSKSKRLPEVITYSGKARSAKDPVEKASLFNEFFSSVFSTKTSNSDSSHVDVINPNLLMDVFTSYSEVKNILCNLDINKATGVDGIPARILRDCAEELSYPLVLLFNLSFRCGRVPSSWKRANVTPVFKSDAKDVVENYRSISLLSIPSKCQEKIVYNAIYPHVAPYLTDWQHGFIRGRSCATQLVLTHHQWTKALDDGLQVDVVFLDFSKAFDRVSHDILLLKLCNFGISGSLLRWCEDYLTHREQRVVIEGQSSAWSVIPSGVPQGSLLGPLFFVIFISDLPNVVMPGNTIALYADDCKTSRLINCTSDQHDFQSDLNNLHIWSQRNLMDFNVKKCKLMRITKKSMPFRSDLKLNESSLEETSEFCDLGLVTSNKLSWNAHVDKISSKANKILGLIKRTCKGMKDVNTLRRLYCALVRSQLEYCTIVWSPFTARNINRLERIQRRATKFILKTDDDYNTRKEQLNLLSLEDRRFFFDVLFFYRVLNGYINIDISSYIQFYSHSERYSLRGKDELKLKKNYARTNTFKFCYFNRIVHMWNGLPLSVRQAPSVSCFKRGVRDYLTARSD